MDFCNYGQCVRAPGFCGYVLKWKNFRLEILFFYIITIKKYLSLVLNEIKSGKTIHLDKCQAHAKIHLMCFSIFAERKAEKYFLNNFIFLTKLNLIVD